MRLVEPVLVELWRLQYAQSNPKKWELCVNGNSVSQYGKWMIMWLRTLVFEVPANIYDVWDAGLAEMGLGIPPVEHHFWSKPLYLARKLGTWSGWSRNLQNYGRPIRLNEVDSSQYTIIKLHEPVPYGMTLILFNDNACLLCCKLSFGNTGHRRIWSQNLTIFISHIRGCGTMQAQSKGYPATQILWSGMREAIWLSQSPSMWVANLADKSKKLPLDFITD